MDDFCTTREAAEILGVSKRRVLAMISAGQLESETADRIKLMPRASVMELAKTRTTKAGRPKGASHGK